MMKGGMYPVWIGVGIAAFTYLVLGWNIFVAGGVAIASVALLESWGL